MWNTTEPVLTTCFLDVTLVWLPVSILWLAYPFLLYRFVNSTSQTIPINFLNVCKFSLSLVLVLVGGFQFLELFWLWNANQIDPAPLSRLIALSVNFVTFFLLMIAFYFQRLFGFVNVGVVWLYLLFQIISNAISIPFSLSLRTEIDMAFMYAELTLQTMLFLLASFPEPTIGKITTWLPSDIHPDEQTSLALIKVEHKPEILCPKDSASFPSQLTFWWFNSLVYLGFRRPLTVDDLWQIRSKDRSEYCFWRFNCYWRHPLFRKDTGSDVGKQPSKISLSSIFYKLFSSSFLFPNLIRFVADMLQLANPMVLKLMIAFTTEANEPFWHGIFYSFVFVVINLFQSCVWNYHQHQMSVISIRMRSTLIGAIYRKSLVLAQHEKNDYTSGVVINLISVDSQRFSELLLSAFFLWTAPAQIAVSMWLLWNELGVSVLGGLLLMVLFIPCNGLIATLVKRIQSKQMMEKDQRLKSTNEMLSGMKILKLYAWEEAFIRMIGKIRATEISLIRRSGLVSLLFVCINECSPFMVAIVTFGIYIFIDPSNVLTAEKAFVSITLFNLVRLSLTMMPNMLTSLISTLVSLKRINNFLNADEVPHYVSKERSQTDAVTITQGTFSWEKFNDSPKSVDDNNGQPTLTDINIRISKRTFVAVVGRVGSGKSSLLSAVLGEMHKWSGYINVSNELNIAYVSQQAWIFNGTIRDNILFGNVYDQARYERVISACALELDLAMMPSGDLTEIGEKGINLSGGQKQRISIARACYSNADLYLFDDPLSAVDSNVGKHLFEQVFSNQNGLLRFKTRILVTNAIYILSDVDQIVLLKNGTINDVGTYEHLMDSNEEFSDLINYFSNTIIEEEEEKLNLFDEDTKQSELIRQQSRTVSQSSSSSIRSYSTFTKSKRSISIAEINRSKLDVSKLIEKESLETGHVSSSVYWKFISALTPCWSFVIVFNYFSVIATDAGLNFWLADWADNPNQTNQLNRFYLLIYGVIGIVKMFFVCFGWISIITGVLNASSSLHSRLIERIAHAPMYFFDITPLGRIVNRFSKDIDVIDNLQYFIRVFMKTTFKILVTIFVISYETPIFLAFVVPFTFLYYCLQRFYIPTSRQLKRMESVTRSPLLSHCSESLNGASTIKAFQATERYIQKMDLLVDNNQRCNYPSSVATFWLTIRLELLANALIFFAAFFAVYSKLTGNGLTGAETGLSLSYALNVTLSLNWFVRTIVDMENNLVSVERIDEYCQAPSESPWNTIEDLTLDPDWPQNGAIRFFNYMTRYRPSLDLVLKGINVSVNDGEKVGIVGRTGAGKSSFTMALFRIIEPTTGDILIDDVNVCKLGLHKLRSRITIIPQDPVLFCGTLRFNLDPFNTYTDEQLWHALELSHLKAFAETLDLRLEYPIVEYGENLSVGQRQLVCLARALLRRTKILVLDEATAAVDVETDSLIQSTIKTEFHDCTVLTIAHRLHTIMDCDRVLVFDSGRVVEFDTPRSLLSNPTSNFYSLAKDAGIV